MIEAGLAPAEVYLTNAIKRFKWEPRGSSSPNLKSIARKLERTK
jgi:hypothetical protein